VARACGFWGGAEPPPRRTLAWRHSCSCKDADQGTAPAGTLLPVVPLPDLAMNWFTLKTAQQAMFLSPGTASEGLRNRGSAVVNLAGHAVSGRHQTWL
jgi:hypothetical protein